MAGAFAWVASETQIGQLFPASAEYILTSSSILAVLGLVCVETLHVIVKLLLTRLFGPDLQTSGQDGLVISEYLGTESII